MIQIEVNGFQSIEQTKICIDGFTSLVGKSNIGKSAVIRALKCALTNSLGTSFVRHGVDCARSLRGSKTCKCQSTVHIKMDGFDLLWEKGDAINRYTFNDQEYDKPGQGIPDFLLSNGFNPVRIGDDSGCIQIADQFFPIFLLNQSGPAVAEIISDVAHLDRINKASKLADKDRREAASTKKVREKDAADLRVRLEGYEGLDNAVLRVSEVATQLKEVEASEVKVATLVRYTETAQALTLQVQDLLRLSSTPTPNFEPVVDAEKKAALLCKFHSDLVRRVTDYKSFSWVAGFLGKVPNIEPLTQQYAQLTTFDGWVIRLRSFKDRFGYLDKVAKAPLPDLNALTDLQKKVGDLSSFNRRVTTLEAAIGKLSSNLDSVTAELTEVEGEANSLGMCPTCTQAVHVGHSHV